MSGDDDGGRAKVPAFGGTKSYDRWKEELKAWQFVTNIGKKKQAVAVALSFPEGSEVRSKIFEEVNIDDLTDDNGVKTLLQHLDNWYKKDEMSAAYEAWTRFDTYFKGKDDSMETYILEFVKRNAVLTKYKVSIPKCILAFKLLDNAGLDLKEKQIVLTAVSFSEPDKMFASMQQALKKFFGSQEVLSLGAGASGSGKSETPAAAVVVKSEPVFNTEEVNVVSRGRGRGGFRGNTGRGNMVNRSERSAQRNSVDRYGNVRKCYVCGSLFHLSTACPKNVYVNSNSEDVQKDAELYAVVESPAMMSVLMTECVSYAILDTACSSTVCGVDWLKMYTQTLSEEEKSSMKEVSSETTFKFGDGNVYKSIKKVKIPVNIIGDKAYVAADVVDCCIPLLFSKKSMKKAQMKLDLENDTAVIHGKRVKLKCTSSGHYCLLLRDEKQVWKRNEEIMLTLGHDEKEKKKKIEKLHQQFGHPTSKKLIQVLKDAGVDDEMCFGHAEVVSNSCEICVKFKKTPSRPIVSVNMAKEFNEVVALDLKEYRKGDIYFLHMIDMATRFSKSCVTKSKEPKEIVEKVVETWLGTGLGAPKKFLCDNGGEFANNMFLDMCENTNIQVMHTAAYSPFSNGLCERNHAVIDEMVEKMVAEQPDLSLRVALAWAVNAKNCLQMVGGFSPYQLVYGRNPNLPCTLSDELPALEGTTSSETVAKHLNASHSARKAFVAAEASEKIRRALRHKVRTTKRPLKNGDKVYFKRDDQKEWKGPAVIIGQDSKTVILKYGSNIVRAHETHIQEIPYSFDKDIEDGRNALLDTLKHQRNEEKAKSNRQETEVVMNPIETPDEHSTVEDTEDTCEDSVVVKSIPKIGQRVRFLPKESDEWQTVKMHSRAGKSTGKYCDWRNIEREDGSVSALDWNKDVEKWVPLPDEDKVQEPSEIVMACENPENKELERAKQEELRNWKNFDVFKEVANSGQKALSVRWVVNEKGSTDGKKNFKARLVARGFEEKEEVQSDSPTVSKEMLRSFVAILSSKKWEVNSIDIKAAFLQSEKFDRDVYLVPPVEAGCDNTVLWKLEKCVYGLNDAARKWYLTVKSFLLKMGCNQVKTDPAAFYWYHDGELCGMFLMHVDDFLWGGTKRFENVVIAQIRNHFQVKEQCKNIFRYIGLNIVQNEQGVTVDQNEYCKSLKSINVSAGRGLHKNMECNEEEKECFRSLVGQLGWLCTNSRPDLSYDVLELSCKVNNPRVEDLIEANKCLRKACTFESSMYFPELGDSSKYKLVVYSDASHAGLPDGSSSAGGFVVFLVGENGNSSPLYWESKRMRRVVKSTLAAETLAATEAVDMAYYLGNMLSEILYDNERKLPVELYVDNHSLYDNVYSVKNVSEKRLRIDIAILKEMIQNGELKIFWVESKAQLADVLTKKGVNVLKLASAFENGSLKL